MASKNAPWKAKMEITLPQLIESFLAAKAIENKSPQTIDWYRQKLTAFCQFVGEHPRVKDLTTDNARAFLADLQGKAGRNGHEDGLSAFTLHGYVRTLKVFATWLVDEEEILAVNPLAKLKRPKLPSVLIEVLTDEEVNRLLDAINPQTPMGARLYAVFSVLLDTGIRASELCTLTLDNTDLDAGQLKVKGKGNKERKVPFGNRCKKAILRYLTTFRPESDSPRLFLNQDGEPLTYNALLLMMRRLGKKAGVLRLHPHLCRHSFAVRFLVNGGDLASLQTILGHTTIVVTQQYLHLAQAQIKEIHLRNSPMDRLMINTGKRNGRVTRQ